MLLWEEYQVWRQVFIGETLVECLLCARNSLRLRNQQGRQTSVITMQCDVNRCEHRGRRWGCEGKGDQVPRASWKRQHLRGD